MSQPDEVREGWHQSRIQAKRNRLRRMLGDGRVVAASSQMCRMRAHRLLRYFAKSACFETQHGDGSPDNHELRAGRAMVLRLSHWRILRRPEASCPSLASVGSTSARTGRSGTFKLASAASRIRAALWSGPRQTSSSTVVRRGPAMRRKTKLSMR